MWGKGRWLTVAAVWGWMVMAPGYVLGSSGFALNEVGARSSALGGAVIARADDLSAIFYNPAGLPQLPGFQVMAGFSTYFPHAEIFTNLGPAGVNGTTADSGTWYIPHLFAAYQCNDRLWLGLGFISPYGLGIKYPGTWAGNINVIQANLQTLNINPTAAVKITDYLSAGAGLDIMYFNFNMKRILPLPLIGPQTLNLGGHSWGVGFNLGLQVKPTDYLSLGVSYRSQVKQQITAPSHFQPFNALDSNASSSVILPDTIFTGIMVRPLKNLSLEGGVVYTRWSLFRNLDIKFDNFLGTLSEHKDWHDTWRGQFGVEYRALSWLDLRAGYAIDEEPMPDKSADYLVPTTSLRQPYRCGTGFRWQAMTLDLAYYLVYMPSRTVNNSQALGVLPTSFEGRVSHALVLSMGYKF
ncbi:MAG: outer membrane protein transport protein [Deltaproteobacteria bacterium]|nr:outer membrane protein transport protein [Deltaproteobacteria bacterium]